MNLNGMPPMVLTGFVAVLFAAIHAEGARLAFLWTVPRSIWLSIAGGVSVAYVFVHLLPELAGHQSAFGESTGGLLPALERHVYLLALLGLTVFYGLERHAQRAKQAAHARTDDPTAAFWLHAGAFAIYNTLIGYLLVLREETDTRGLLIYAIAMGLHFVVNDQGLRAHHGCLYDRIARWPLALSPLLGWALGLAVSLPTRSVAALFAVLAGGVVLNVLKEELPENRQSRFSAFALGAAGYAALLLFT